MKVHFDQKSDALYFRLDESPIVESEEVKPGVILDFNAKNQSSRFRVPGSEFQVQGSGLQVTTLNIEP